MPRYRFTSTDKITGRTFKLCSEGKDEDSAAQKVWELGFLISKSEPCPWIKDPTLKPKSKFINDEFLEDKNHLEGKVRSVSLINDFERMTKEYDTECDKEDRHFFLNGLVLHTERKDDPNLTNLCELFCWQWFVERHDLVKCVVERAVKEMGHDPVMYEVAAVNRLRIMHDDERKAQVCEYAADMPYPHPSRGWLLKKAEEYREGHI